MWNYTKNLVSGFRAIVFDIDNTLVHHGDDSTDEVDELFYMIQGMGFKTFILSNNSEVRIQRFLKNIDSPYIYDAQKPDVKNYLKAVNIEIACNQINGMIIHPGEVFSFWKSVGKTTKKRGFKEGRVIEKNRLKAGIGGGLCNLANTIHLLVLHSPLEVTEFHKHCRFAL